MTYPMVKASEYSTDQNVHAYSAYVTFDAAAILTAVGKGFTITRTGVGTYTITLPQPYKRFVRLPRIAWAKAAGAAAMLQVIVDDLTTLGTTGVFKITTVLASGVATEPAVTEIATIDWAVTQDQDASATSVLV